MKEIGGYFEFEQLLNQPYHTQVVELNTARHALIYLVMAKEIEKIYIPKFLCSSVSSVLESYSIPYETYSIDKDFLPIFNTSLNGNEFLYIVNYYGQLSEKTINELNNKHKNIIVDNVQAFFQKPIPGIDTIYSCRKYFGVPDGAYLSTDVRLGNKLAYDTSMDRMKHLLGRYEGNASDYYLDFKKVSSIFKDEPVKKMSKLTNNLLGAIDYHYIMKRRNLNFSFLHEKLSTTNKLKLTDTKGPFAYPYYVENGITIRKKLASKNIFIPTLWPEILKNENKDSIEYKYASNILPLPCDHRYTKNDMEIIIKELSNV